MIFRYPKIFFFLFKGFFYEKMIYKIRNLLPRFLQEWIKLVYIKYKKIPGDRKTLLKLRLMTLIWWNVHIWYNSKIYSNIEAVTGNFSIWDYSYIWYNAYFCFYWSKIEIWKFCSISNDVSFITWSDHNYRALTTFPSWKLDNRYEKASPIIIGNDVRIWKNVIISKWVTVW
jgi:acetyltransferase-like isoleucine patch superfamily enzyme